MKEHKIEILCQMEDERDSPVEHCNAGPGDTGPGWKPLFGNDQSNIQSGLGLGGLLGALGSGLLGQFSGRKPCFYCGR